MDPVSQFIGYSDLLYSLGFADSNERTIIVNKYETPIVELLARGDLKGAFHVFDEFLNGDFFPYPTYFFNITGMNNESNSFRNRNIQEYIHISTFWDPIILRIHTLIS
jgi:vitellogenic carboxypeptidase-like protein